MMSPLENKIQEVQHLEQKGYNYDQIQCASLMLIAEELRTLNGSVTTLMEYADNATD